VLKSSVDKHFTACTVACVDVCVTCRQFSSCWWLAEITHEVASWYQYHNIRSTLPQLQSTMHTRSVGVF